MGMVKRLLEEYCEACHPGDYDAQDDLMDAICEGRISVPLEQMSATVNQYKGGNMKVNSKVKVKWVKDLWREGTILDIRPFESGMLHVAGDLKEYKVGIGEPHYFNYEEKWLTRSEFKEYVELPEGAAEKTHAEQLPLALAMVEEALAALMPGTKVEVKDGSLCACGLTMDPVVYEQETIGQFIERAGWQVTFWKHYSATRSQPEDSVDCPIEGPLHWNLACQLFVRSILIAKADAYWDAKADEAYAKQLEEEAAMVF